MINNSGGIQMQTQSSNVKQQQQQQQQGGMQMQSQHPSQMQNHMTAQNHMNTQQMLNHALNNSGGLPPMQMPPMQGNIYDHMHGVNMNGVGLPKEQQQQQQQLVYLSQQPPMNLMTPQNQFMNAARNTAVSELLLCKKNCLVHIFYVNLP